MSRGFFETIKRLSKNKYIRIVGAPGILTVICAAAIANSGFMNVSFDPNNYYSAQASNENDIIFDGVAYSEGKSNDDSETVSRNDENSHENNDDDIWSEGESQDEFIGSQTSDDTSSGRSATVGKLSDNASTGTRADVAASAGTGTGNIPVIGNVGGRGIVGDSGSGAVIPTSDKGGKEQTNVTERQTTSVTATQQPASKQTNSTAPSAANANNNNNNDRQARNTVTRQREEENEEQTKEEIRELGFTPKATATPTERPIPGSSSSGTSSAAQDEPITSEQGTPTQTENTNPSGSEVTAPEAKKPTQAKDPETVINEEKAPISTGHDAFSGEATELRVRGDFEGLSKGESTESIFSNDTRRSISLVFENGDSMLLMGASYEADGVSISGLDTSKETSGAVAKVTYIYGSRTYTADISYSVEQWKLSLCGFDGGIIADNMYPDSELGVKLTRYSNAMKGINERFCGWSAAYSDDEVTDVYYMKSASETLYPCTKMSEPPENDSSSVLTVPDGYTDVDFSTFGICEQYEKIVLPSSVKNINLSGIADNLTNVKEIETDGENSTYSVTDGVLYMGNTLVYVPPKKESISEFKDGVTDIGERAFEDCVMESVELPDTVNEIKSGAFLNSQIGTLTVSADYYHVCKNAFFSETKTPSVKKIVSKALYISDIDDGALNFGGGMPEIVLPDSKSDVIYQRYLAEWGVRIDAFYGDGNAVKILTTETGAQNRNLLKGKAVYSFFEEENKLTLACVNESAEGEFLVDRRTVKILSDAFEGCAKITTVAIGISPCELEDGCFEGMESFSALSLSCEPCEITVDTFRGIDPDNFNIIVPNEYYEQYMVQWGTVIDEQFSREVAIQIFVVAFNGGYITIDNARYIRDGDELILMRVGESYTGCFIPAEGTTQIAKNAFYGALKLDSVIIPETVKVIDKNAMASGVSIDSVFVNSSERLDLSSFEGAELFVPEAQRSLYTDEFADINACEDRYVSDEDDIIYSGSVLVHVPKTYSGDLELDNEVTAVYARAAKNCRLLRSVTFSNTAEIGDEAFYNCASLEKAVFGNSPIERIGDRAFYSCVSLSKADMPARLETIGDEAFAYCDMLKTVNFASYGASNVKTIGDRAFYSCASLRGVDSADTIDLNELWNISDMGDGVFAACPLIKSVVMPDMMTRIPDGMFENCALLSYVDWRNTETIGKNAFRGTSIENLELSSYIVSSIEDGAFASCDKLYTIALGRTLNYLSPEFTDSGKRLIAYIPYGVPELDADNVSAVMDNGQLYNTVYTTSENDAEAAKVFENTSPHDGIYTVDNGSLYEKLSAAESGLVKIGIHKTDFEMMTSTKVTRIDDNAAAECGELETVIWNKSAEQVPAYAFADNDRLRSFTFRDVTNQVPAQSCIGEFAFKGCTALESIYLPNSVSEVKEGAFMDCSGMLSIQWRTPADIPKDAFSGCERVKSFGVAADSIRNVRSIGEGAFKDCRSLSDIGGLDELQFAYLEEIGASAFENCDELQELVIPSSVKMTGDNAFGGCERLGRVRINGEPEEIGSMIFGEDAGESFFEVDNVEKFRSVWGDILRRDYGDDAPERLIKGVEGVSGETPEVSETPEPSETPAASETPEPSETPEVSEAPEESEAPEPSETPEASAMPEASETPEESEAPEPSETPEPSEEPEPSEIPEVSETPEQSEEPEVSEGPEPSEMIEVSELLEELEPSESDEVAIDDEDCLS